ELIGWGRAAAEGVVTIPRVGVSCRVECVVEVAVEARQLNQRTVEHRELLRRLEDQSLLLTRRRTAGLDSRPCAEIEGELGPRRHAQSGEAHVRDGGRRGV